MSSPATAPVIVALVPDVFFSITVRNVIRASGAEAVLLRQVADLPQAAQERAPVLLIVDLTALADDAAWETVSGLVGGDLPSLGFGPHREAVLLRRGRSVGMTKVVPNSVFHATMPELINAVRADATDVAAVSAVDDTTDEQE